MTHGDVHTRAHPNGWENNVEGCATLTRLFPSRAEAVVSGRALATGLATRHVVHDQSSCDVVPVPQYLDAEG